MKKKYKFTYKDGKEIEIEAGEKFVKAHESGGCAGIHCYCCPLKGKKCPEGFYLKLFQNTKLEVIKEMEKKTYNFIEAVNSGKRFRPVNWSKSIDGDGWYKWNGGLVFTDSGVIKITKQYLNFSYTLEEKTITITESQFDNAWDKRTYMPEIKKEVKQELGF